MAANQRLFKGMYRRAGRAEKLPWHRDDPPHFLQQALGRKAPPARALDVGCGAGGYSLVMAKAGYEVTGIDFIEAALVMARSLSAQQNVPIVFEQANVLEYRPSTTFDLVLDSGCLHGFGGADDRRSYRSNLMSWLPVGGHLVLVHFNKRHVLDWRPIGPNRWKREQVVEFLGSEFTELEYHEEIRDESGVAAEDVAEIVQEALSTVFLKLDRLSLGLSLGTVAGVLLSLATLMLVLKGGDAVGPNLQLLTQYFPGYRVTLFGSLVGLGYGFVSGLLVGWVFAFIRNAALFLSMVIIHRRSEATYLRRFLEYL